MPLGLSIHINISYFEEVIILFIIILRGLAFYSQKRRHASHFLLVIFTTCWRSQVEGSRIPLVESSFPTWTIMATILRACYVKVKFDQNQP